MEQQCSAVRRLPPSDIDLVCDMPPFRSKPIFLVSNSATSAERDFDSRFANLIAAVLSFFSMLRFTGS